MTSEFAKLWDIDPDTTYLNHGSFGPSPIEVRAVREEWSAKLERQPMRFLLQQMEDKLDNVADALASLLSTKANRIALVDNATVAMNIAACSVKLQEGDNVLLTDHEYGAVRNIWQERCRQAGAKLRSVRLPYPLDDDGVVDAIADAIDDRTRVLVFSHVTSPTAAIFPAERICEVTRRRGVISVIDGPHAVAMLDVNLKNIGCDFYCASCHKWMCAPFGTGFLWAHPRHHSCIRCPIVSWGGSMSGRPPIWQDRINWLGTRDPAPLLAIPAAIDFFKRIGFDAFRSHAHELICQARDSLLAIEDFGPLCTPFADGLVSMCAVELPQPENWEPGYHGHADKLQLELRDEHGIEVPVASWNGHRFMRVSAHLYNSMEDVTKLVDAVKGAESLR